MLRISEMMEKFDTLIIIFFSLAVCEFSLGVFQAYYANMYYQYKDECENIWGVVVTESVINICISLLTFCIILIFVRNNSDNNNEETVLLTNLDMTANKYRHKALYTILSLLHVIQIIVLVWTTVIYFSIDDYCYFIWQLTANNFWTIAMFLPIMVGLFIYCVIFLLLFFGFCLVCIVIRDLFSIIKHIDYYSIFCNDRYVLGIVV